jgi:hypothetical protein
MLRIAAMGGVTVEVRVVPSEILAWKMSQSVVAASRSIFRSTCERRFHS